MKKTIGILGVVALVLAMFFSTSNLNTNNNDLTLVDLLTMNSANAETPRLSDPIWNVKVIVGWPSNQLECETGGNYKCEVDS